jgi:SAM-dependent methyltransferase
MDRQPHYDTWIRKRSIVIYWALAVVLGTTALLGLIRLPLALLGITGLPFLYIAIIISMTARRFSPKGGSYQDLIHQLLVDSVSPADTILDVGCGSGSLIVKIAKRFSPARCVGVDLWSEDWEYSHRQCAQNAAAEGVPDIEFIRASASRLPFQDDTVDCVVSCLTFHEVRDTDDKTVAITEALRVTRPGGCFAFLDLFASEKLFGGLERVVDAMSSAGASVASKRRLAEIITLPFPLDTPRALKYAVLVVGTKPR